MKKITFCAACLTAALALGIASADAEAYPRVSDGATAPMLYAENARLIEVIRRLAIEGVEHCPLVDRAQEVMRKEAQALLTKNPSASCPP